MSEHRHLWDIKTEICEACSDGRHWYCSCAVHCKCEVCKRHKDRMEDLDSDYSEDVDFILDNDFSEKY